MGYKHGSAAVLLVCLLITHRCTMSATTTNPAARTFPSEKIRGLFLELADAICASQPTVSLSIKGSNINIHLEDSTLNISLSSREGGER